MCYQLDPQLPDLLTEEHYKERIAHYECLRANFPGNPFFTKQVENYTLWLDGSRAMRPVLSSQDVLPF